MKKSIVVLALVVLSFAVAQNAMAQTTTQSFNVAVNAVYKIATTGTPADLTITTGTAGNNALTTVSDASTTFAITQNASAAGKVTASLSPALPAGYSLQIQLAGINGGTSAGAQDISSGSAKDVVTAINRGADAGKTITYTFGANATAGVLLATTETVTLTLTN